MDSPHQVTELLIAWRNGDTLALDQLMPLVERELRRIARRHLSGERNGNLLQTTALVNEAYLKLIDQRDPRFQNRTHFFAIAARLMRRILVDHARAQHRAKRGGDAYRVSLSAAEQTIIETPRRMIELDEALDRLSVQDPRKSKVIELRYFGGLSVEETAEMLGVSPTTVMRDWNMARAWLRGEICE